MTVAPSFSMNSRSLSREQAVRGRPPQYASAPCELTTSSYLFPSWHLFQHVGYLRHQQQVDIWPFDLESGVRVMCDVGYLCANFSLPRPLCSWVTPDVCDRRQTKASLNASALCRMLLCTSKILPIFVGMSELLYKGVNYVIFGHFKQVAGHHVHVKKQMQEPWQQAAVPLAVNLSHFSNEQDGRGSNLQNRLFCFPHIPIIEVYFQKLWKQRRHSASSKCCVRIHTSRSQKICGNCGC